MTNFNTKCYVHIECSIANLNKYYFNYAYALLINSTARSVCLLVCLSIKTLSHPIFSRKIFLFQNMTESIF